MLSTWKLSENHRRLVTSPVTFNNMDIWICAYQPTMFSVLYGRNLCQTIHMIFTYSNRIISKAWDYDPCFACIAATPVEMFSFQSEIVLHWTHDRNLICFHGNFSQNRTCAGKWRVIPRSRASQHVCLHYLKGDVQMRWCKSLVELCKQKLHCKLHFLNAIHEINL